ncbi:uncharacterized protein LOC116205129 isoform X2 [Punica granatum]|uniref:non-specific serine/threonine protein kinase n=1 Tax=Punica granatum TaxID=22663 RepID=A0A6P8DJE1_PUNGR|nr:uncharacterized protein LOC116205129 isoform X2 [Punica granatum]
MVIKNFTFVPDDPDLDNARPGSPHPFFSKISWGSSSSDAYCSKCIHSLTSIYNSRTLSTLIPDNRVRTGAGAEAQAAAEDRIEMQIFAHHTEQQDIDDKEVAPGFLANVLAFLKKIRKIRSPPSHYFGEEDHFGHIHLQRFSMGELQVATENFSPDNILGRGVFGKVYKGRLANGSLVAVKRMKEKCSQAGESQFHREILMVGLALHRNLIRLHGICMDSKERLLVYPYMANGSVASRLRAIGHRDSQPPLDWPTRKQIALGAARGLAYLHEHCKLKIIHRDVKAANILLDGDFEAVICDFGIATFMDYKDTHVTAAVCGTVGHIAPEYLSKGSVSVKTDVFGYGVMLLELITGQKASDLAQLAFDEDVMLLDWVKGLLGGRKLDVLVDSAMRGNYVEEEVEQLVQVALLCTQVNATERPEMSKVVKMLEGEGLVEKWEKWQKKEMLQEPDPVNLEASPVSCEEGQFGHIKRFSLNELLVATDNFSPENILGRGRFGMVYKGCLADGSLVAVKRLKEARSQGAEMQLQTELLMFDLTVHRNLLKLRGFCTSSMERLLIYPYMVNGSVASRLRAIDCRDPQPPLEWTSRKQIALGVARGLAYLHEQCNQKIIHRNIKAANIFLDKDFTPVVGDFGLAKLIDYRDINVETAIHGTFAHIAPEYLSMGVVSEKTDVFSYGVMLLELITGQNTSDLARLAYDEDIVLLDWVKGLWREGKLEVLADSDIKGNHVDEEVEQLIQIALLCTQVAATKRPKMSKVVGMLEGEGLAARWVEWQKEEMLQEPLPVNLDTSLVSCEEVYFGHLKRFSLRELQVATDNFSCKNILGRGGFGKVYKGRLAEGSLVAVKRLKEEHSQGGELQFQTELEMISLAVHRNLLKLIGFCMTPTERLLVYPYMANGSVALCLRERSDSQPPLGWPTRKHIALGAARGLAYLHEHCNPKIIHRDVKAANILLDEDFEPVVGDFGLAKLMHYRDTHVTTAVRGTIGHIPLEYLSTGVASDKTDVFGYGIMLLEILTGQRALDVARLANDEDVLLLDWVKRTLRERRLEVLIDSDIQGKYVEEEVEQLIQVALLCTQLNANERPKMSKVVGMLEGEGLAERWKEWQKEEMLQASNKQNQQNTYLFHPDSASLIPADELSGPR